MTTTEANAAIMALGAEFQVGDRVRLCVDTVHAGYAGIISSTDHWPEHCIVKCDAGTVGPNEVALSARYDELELINE